ncbi:hypothetical protein KXD40_006523 [Peronospora effusa]|nr:hypothetical protein KXD40_006523 [Peronospora effusa]
MYLNFASIFRFMWPRRQASHGGSSAAQKSIPTASLVLNNASPSSSRSSLLTPLLSSRKSAEKAENTSIKPHNEAKSGVDDAAWLLRALDKKKRKKVTTKIEKKAVGSLNIVKLGKTSQKTSKIDRKGGAYGLAMSLKEQQQLWRKGAVKKHQDNAKAVAKDQEREQQETGFDRVFQEVFCEEQEVKRRDENESKSIFCKRDRGADTSELRLSFLKSSNDEDSEKQILSNEEKETETWKFASAGNDVLNLDDFDASSNSTVMNSSMSVEATKAAEFNRWKAEDTQSVVSDNFVRLNMRKRFKGSSGRAKKRPAYLRARNENPLDEVTGDNSNGIAPLVDAKGSQQRKQEKSLLADDGVDFIEECLEALTKAEKACGLSDHETFESTKRKRETQPLQPPRCHHALNCQSLEVKKRNKNHGRRFFACPLAFDEGRCDFFLWEDDHVPLALQTLFTAPSSIDSGESAAEAEAIECVPLDIEASEDEQRDAMRTNLRLVFGHTDFRPGQQWAISRVLHRQDTLLVLPTGAGKSLCYQFPALFLPGITLVISPLISLMNDQYESLPAPLKARAVCLSGFSGSGSSKAKHAAFVRDLLAEKLSLIFLSPEKALGAGMQALLAMPRVRARLALVCVDEAHCISEWSHHFRPSYLRLAEVFRHAQCVLCVTATASRRVVHDVLRQLRSRRELQVAANRIPEDERNMVLQMPWQRKNLALEVRSVSCNDERLRHLVHILPELSKGSTQPSKANGGGVIVYVHQQRQTEELAALLREQLPSTWRSSGKVMAFHAGMSLEAKEKVRTGFARGRVRVVVATVAFGMGIDKKNVRAVVHFHMPSSVEGYVQQVGRAGRDGKAARALLYLLHEDAVHYRSLIFSTALHRDQLRRLLTFVFLNHAISATSSKDHVIAVEHCNQKVGGLTLVSLERDWLERHLDLKAATIETFLTLLALETQRGKNTNEDNSLDLRVVLQPLSMSRCTLQLLETQAKKLATRSCAKLLLEAVQRNELPNARVTHRKDGYLSSWAVDFHLHEAAQWYERTINARGTVEKSDTTLASSGAQQDGDTNAAAVAAATNERRMLQELRIAQQTGHVQRLSLCQPAFQIQLSWQVELSEKMKAEVVERWTNTLYAKHEHLESRQLARLAHLYGALHTAALPTPSPTASRHRIEDEKDETKVLEDKALALEAKFERYFDDDDEKNDGIEGESGFEDKHLLQKIQQPLTSSLIESIERDTCSLVQLRLDGSDPMEGSEAKGHKNSDDGTKWTSYSVAKVFHGLTTPQLSIQRWRDHLCWRRYSDVAFEHIVQIVNKVLLENQTTNAVNGMGDKYGIVPN